MYCRYAYLTGGLGAALAIACLAVALEGQATTVRPSVDSANSDTVDRAHKSDRLRVVPRPSGAEPFDVRLPRSPRPALDGCESSFSSISQSSKMERSSSTDIAGRCLT
jgi:hypothetical protein